MIRKVRSGCSPSIVLNIHIEIAPSKILQQR
jgi:hypothetical protein